MGKGKSWRREVEWITPSPGKKELSDKMKVGKTVEAREEITFLILSLGLLVIPTSRDMSGFLICTFFLHSEDFFFFRLANIEKEPDLMNGTYNKFLCYTYYFL